MNLDETTAVVIYTDSFRIEGRIELMPGARLIDFVRHAPAFIGVMDAKVSDRTGKSVFDAEFLDVGSAWIELIVPTSQLVRGRTPGRKGKKRTPARARR